MHILTASCTQSKKEFELIFKTEKEKDESTNFDIIQQMFENVASTASTLTHDENGSKSGEDMDQEFRVMAIDEIWKDVEIGVEKWKNIKKDKEGLETDKNKVETKTEENS